MRKRIILGLGIVALAVVAATFQARAQGNGWGRCGGLGGPSVERIVERVSDRLDLNDAQKAQVNSIIAAERPRVEALFAQLGEGHRQMRAATANGQFNEEQVQQLAAQQAQTLTELFVAKERVKANVYQVLTPEQRTKADQMLDRMESRFGGRFAHKS